MKIKTPNYSDFNEIQFSNLMNMKNNPTSDPNIRQAKGKEIPNELMQSKKKEKKPNLWPEYFKLLTKMNSKKSNNINIEMVNNPLPPPKIEENKKSPINKGAKELSGK
jgi:hypothetical protein